jgi:hypothetical protein
MWQYAAAPGDATEAPIRWPSATRLTRDASRPSLLMFVHAECPCSRASVTELGRLLGRAPVPPAATVVFVHSREGELWRQASRLQGVTLFADADSSEARRFGASTSGATLLYDSHGQLVFSGGLTASRGHEGSGMGEERLVTLLEGATPDRAESPIFGCPLQDKETR